MEKNLKYYLRIKLIIYKVINEIQLYDPQSTHLIIRGFIQYLDDC